MHVLAHGVLADSLAPHHLVLGALRGGPGLCEEHPQSREAEVERNGQEGDGHGRSHGHRGGNEAERPSAAAALGTAAAAAAAAIAAVLAAVPVGPRDLLQGNGRAQACTRAHSGRSKAKYSAPLDGARAQVGGGHGAPRPDVEARIVVPDRRTQAVPIELMNQPVRQTVVVEGINIWFTASVPTQSILRNKDIVFAHTLKVRYRGHVSREVAPDGILVSDARCVVHVRGEHHPPVLCI
mmetsp:Transcript_110353/g.312042  ORF Transcript_110353/g.312042 Transcript_110353/m.312042 type:complete len:238 (+) Transcript_110353:333-1046(+)